MKKKPIETVRQKVRTAIARLAYLLNRVSGGRVTPNQVTYLGVAMHLPIAMLIGGGELYWAAGLLCIFGLFDVLDGELARLQKRASTSGMVLDATTDRLKETLVYGGIAYYLAAYEEPAWACLAVLACGFAITTSYAKAKGEVGLAIKQQSADHHSVNRHFKESLAPFEIRMTIVILGLLFDQLLAAVGIIAVLALWGVQRLLSSISRQLEDGV